MSQCRPAPDFPPRRRSLHSPRARDSRQRFGRSQPFPARPPSGSSHVWATHHSRRSLPPTGGRRTTSIAVTNATLSNGSAAFVLAATEESTPRTTTRGTTSDGWPPSLPARLPVANMLATAAGSPDRTPHHAGAGHRPVPTFLVRDKQRPSKPRQPRNPRDHNPDQGGDEYSGKSRSPHPPSAA